MATNDPFDHEPQQIIEIDEHGKVTKKPRTNDPFDSLAVAWLCERSTCGHLLYSPDGCICDRGYEKSTPLAPIPAMRAALVEWLKVEACKHDYKDEDGGYAIRVVADTLERTDG